MVFLKYVSARLIGFKNGTLMFRSYIRRCQRRTRKRQKPAKKGERTNKQLAEEAANGYLTRKIVIAKEWEEQAARGEINLKHVFVDPGSTHLVEAVDDGDGSDEGGVFNRYHYSAERLKWDSGVFKQQKHLERLKKGEINAIERELQLHPKDRTDLQSIRARNQTVFKHLFTLIDFYASDRVSLQRWQNHIGKERAITHLAHELVSMRPPPGGKKERSKNEPFSFERGHASGGRVTRCSTYNHRKTKAGLPATQAQETSKEAPCKTGSSGSTRAIWTARDTEEEEGDGSVEKRDITREGYCGAWLG